MDFHWEKLLILLTTKNSSLEYERKSPRSILFGIAHSSINSNIFLFISLSHWVIVCIDENKNTAANYVQFVLVRFGVHWNSRTIHIDR